MPNFEVTLIEKNTYVVPDIQAINEDEAIDKAWELIDEEENKDLYYIDSDGESDAIKL